MVKHEFTFYDNSLSVDGQIGQKTEIIVPGTDIIIPDELAIDITQAINDTKDAAIAAIHNNSLPNYTVTITASSSIGYSTISFILPDIAILRSVQSSDIDITTVIINNSNVSLPCYLTGNSTIILVGNIIHSQQLITLTLSPLPSNRSIQLPNPAITTYLTYPIASGCWVPTESKIVLLGYSGNTNYGYIFDQYNNYISTNLYNVSFGYTPVQYIPINNCIYITNGSQIVPYYFATKSYGLPLTLSGTIYSQSYNADDNILYVGTSTGLYIINPANNNIINYNSTYTYCSYLAYINTGTQKLLVIARNHISPSNPVILNATTLQLIASYDYASASYNIYTAQPCYHAATQRIYLSMYKNITNAMGHIKVIDINPSSSTYLQLIGTINNVYARWALLVGDRLYTSSSISGSNSTVSIVSIPSHTVTNVSMPISSNVTYIYHPIHNAIYVCSINGIITILPHHA